MINSECPSCSYKFNPFKKLMWNTQKTYDCPNCEKKLAISYASDRIFILVMGVLVLAASVIAFPEPQMISKALWAFPICLVAVVTAAVYMLRIELSKE